MAIPETLDTSKLRSLEKLPIKTVLGYGAGDFAFNLAFSLSTAFLLYYYTDVAGISAAAVGTMFLVVRLWDAFADLLAGRLVDRTMTRWGKFRPFIMFGAVPLLFMSFLTFQVPASFDEGMKLVYAYATYAILGLLYSLVNIPYGSLASAVTQSVRERAKLVAARAFGAGVGGVVLTFVVGGFIQDLRGQKALIKTPEDLIAYQAAVQGVFTKVTLAFIVVGTAAFWFTAWACRERVIRTQPSITRQRNHRHPEVEQAAGLPVRVELLLPDRPVRGRRGHRLLRPVRARQYRPGRPHHPGQRRHRVADHPVHPEDHRPVRQEERLPVLRRVHHHRRRRPFLRPGQHVVAGAAHPGHQGHWRQPDQHRDVRSGSRHRRVRRVEDRQAQRGRHLRIVLLHPQGHPVASAARWVPGRWPSAATSPPAQPTRTRSSPRARSSPSRPPSVCCPPSPR